MPTPALAVFYEHPTWQQPLFDALDKRGIDYLAYDVKSAAFNLTEDIQASTIFNQVSPSAYVRGNGHAVPFTLALLDHLESTGARVINGACTFRLELDKIAQIRLMRDLGMDYPWTVAFNNVDALRDLESNLYFPEIL